MGLSRSILLLALSAFCAGAVQAQERWTGTSDVRFKGYSTLHDFTGRVADVPLKVTVSPGKAGRVVDAVSDVEVRRMSTENEKRDANMMAMFNEAKYRLLKVEVTGAQESDLKPSGGRPGSMSVALTIAGHREVVKATVADVQEGPAAVSFNLAFPISLKAFGLAPPKALGGLMKVKDTVDVKVQVRLRKAD